MRTDGQDFLEKLARFPGNTFEARFLESATRLGLVAELSGEELRLLYRAAFRGALCNIALNGLGGCEGRIKPERELNRVRLEEEFMASCSKLYWTAGWRRLQWAKRVEVRNSFLHVRVADENLAW